MYLYSSFHSSPYVYFLLIKKSFQKLDMTATNTTLLDYRSFFSYPALRNTLFYVVQHPGPVLKIGLSLEPLVCFELASFFFFLKLHYKIFTFLWPVTWLTSVHPCLTLHFKPLTNTGKDLQRDFITLKRTPIFIELLKYII